MPEETDLVEGFHARCPHCLTRVVLPEDSDFEEAPLRCYKCRREFSAEEACPPLRTTQVSQATRERFLSRTRVTAAIGFLLIAGVAVLAVHLNAPLALFFCVPLGTGCMAIAARNKVTKAQVGGAVGLAVTGALGVTGYLLEIDMLLGLGVAIGVLFLYLVAFG